MALKQTQSQLRSEFKKVITELKDTIHLKCYECSACQADGYSDCQITDCPLYPFRLTSGIGNRSKRLQKKAYKLKRELSE